MNANCLFAGFKFLLRRFFLRGDFAFFAGVFENLGVQNVVFCVVNDGGFVVKVWWKMPLKPSAKNMPMVFEIYFGPTCGTAGCESRLA